MEPTTEAMVDEVVRLVRAESPTSDTDACGRAVEAAAEMCGRWLPGSPRVVEHRGRPVLQWGPIRPSVLLLGHLDTVWPLGTIERLPCRAEGDRLMGPGVFDMKAGAVQAVIGLALSGAGAEDGVGLLLTTDEETGSPTSRDLIAEVAGAAEAALVFEPSLDGRLKTRRKGTSWYSVRCIGRAAHAGLDPERGINALLDASAFALAAQHWGDAPAGTTVTPTTMHAGTTTNTVAADAVLTLDVRAWTRAEQERVDELVRSWLPTHGIVEISGGIDRAALEAENSAGLFAIAQSVATGVGIKDLGEASVGGASDGNLTAAMGIPTLDGLGAVGDGAHADHEWASVPDLLPRARLAAGLIDSLRGGGHG